MNNTPINVTPEGIAALRLLIADATPGPWRLYKSQILLGERDEWVEMPTRSDASYIAAIPPEVMRAILDRLAAVEAESAQRATRIEELENARRLCEDCDSDDREHDLDLTGDLHCGACGGVI